MDEGGRDAREWEAAGLYDPAAPDAEERLALLEYLRERGACLEDLRAADAEGRLVGLAGELRRRGLLRLTARELAEEADFDLVTILRVARAAGLPAYDEDVPMFRTADAPAFRAAGVAIDAFGEVPVLQFTRTVGAALASIADSAMAMFGIEVAGRFEERGVTEVDRAAAVDAASALLIEQVPVTLETLFFHHVQAAVGRGTGTHTLRLAVGFVDLVRSTTLVQELASAELAEVIGSFERHAVELVGERGGRIVKTIGDEVMLVLPDAGQACDAVLSLRDAIAAEPRLPAMRGGLALGDLVRGYGDFYGPDVTTAARIVKAAEPGTVLVTDRIRLEAGPGFDFRSVGPFDLRGFVEPVELHALARA